MWIFRYPIGIIVGAVQWGVLFAVFPVFTKQPFFAWVVILPTVCIFSNLLTGWIVSYLYERHDKTMAKVYGDKPKLEEIAS